jgi:hypothetical protein
MKEFPCGVCRKKNNSMVQQKIGTVLKTKNTDWW